MIMIFILVHPHRNQHFEIFGLQSKPQSQLRVKTYTGLMNHLGFRNVAQNGDERVCRYIFLPSSFQGDRGMQQNFQDAMAIVPKYSKPHIYL